MARNPDRGLSLALPGKDGEEKLQMTKRGRVKRTILFQELNYGQGFSGSSYRCCEQGIADSV
jgi:hypothetical protein